MQHVLGTLGQTDNISEVKKINDAGYKIDAVGIQLTDATYLGYLGQVEGGPSGTAALVDNVKTANDLVDLISSLAGSSKAVDVGDDVLRGGDGNDIIFGDSIYVDHQDGGWDVFVSNNPGKDLDDLRSILAGSHADYGREGSVGGNDTLYGGAGNDILYGQGGDDTLYGDSGNDRLIGGTGDDILWGGTGSDTFVWTAADRGGSYHDIVKDFTAGDKLDLSALLDGVNESTTLTELTAYLSFDNTTNSSNTVISVSSLGAGSVDQIITLEGYVLSGDAGTIISQLLTDGQLQVVV
jgi:Ca2+-binding RTX toxin-like protein